MRDRDWEIVMHYIWTRTRNNGYTFLSETKEKLILEQERDFQSRLNNFPQILSTHGWQNNE